MPSGEFLVSTLQPIGNQALWTIWGCCPSFALFSGLGLGCELCWALDPSIDPQGPWGLVPGR